LGKRERANGSATVGNARRSVALSPWACVFEEGLAACCLRPAHTVQLLLGACPDEVKLCRLGRTCARRGMPPHVWGLRTLLDCCWGSALMRVRRASAQAMTGWRARPAAAATTRTTRTTARSGARPGAAPAAAARARGRPPPSGKRRCAGGAEHSAALCASGHDRRERSRPAWRISVC